MTLHAVAAIDPELTLFASVILGFLALAFGIRKREADEDSPAEVARKLKEARAEGVREGIERAKLSEIQEQFPGVLDALAAIRNDVRELRAEMRSGFAEVRREQQHDIEEVRRWRKEIDTERESILAKMAQIR